MGREDGNRRGPRARLNRGCEYDDRFAVESSEARQLSDELADRAGRTSRWQVTARVTQYKEEADSDVHLVLKDSANRSMIAEIPAPSCVGSTSRWKANIATSRTTWTRTYPLSTSWHYINRSVTLRDLGFFDPPHGQTGIARNGIALHPVIHVQLNGTKRGWSPCGGSKSPVGLCKAKRFEAVAFVGVESLAIETRICASGQGIAGTSTTKCGGVGS